MRFSGQKRVRPGPLATQRLFTSESLHRRREAERLIMEADTFIRAYNQSAYQLPVDSLDSMHDDIIQQFALFEIIDDNDPRLRMQSFAPTGQLSNAYPQIVEGPNPRSARDEDIERLYTLRDTFERKVDMLYHDDRRDEFQQGLLDEEDQNQYRLDVQDMISDAQRSGLETQSLEQLTAN